MDIEHSDLQTGDTVILRSGSVTMTVESVDGWKIHCVWQNDVDGLIHEREFDAQMLKKVDSPYDDPEPRISAAH